MKLVQALLSVILGGGEEKAMENTTALLFLMGHALNSLSLVATDAQELADAANLDSVIQLLKLVGPHVV